MYSEDPGRCGAGYRFIWGSELPENAEDSVLACLTLEIRLEMEGFASNRPTYLLSHLIVAEFLKQAPCGDSSLRSEAPLRGALR